jgi:hypothetical protein
LTFAEAVGGFLARFTSDRPRINFACNLQAPSRLFTVVLLQRFKIQEGELDKQQLAILAPFLTGAWVVWLLFDAIRQYLRIRSQAVAQDKLLVRVSSPESLEVFLASESGKQFLRSLEPNPKDAWRSIIRSSQTAAIFAVLGTGTLLCHFSLPETQGLLLFSLGAFILSAAFGVSTLVSWSLHRRAGLLPDGE